MTSGEMIPNGKTTLTDRSRYRGLVGGGLTFWAAKRSIDVAMSVALLPIVGTVWCVLALLNPWLNRGPVIERHLLTGRNLKPFTAIKFRLLQPGDVLTPFGRVLQKYRIDEIPLILGVLRGEMSVVGPPPDRFENAREISIKIPEYHQRHLVRPGITGLAQVLVGRAVGIDAVRNKVAADLAYVRNASAALDLRVLWLTLVPVKAVRRDS